MLSFVRVFGGYFGFGGVWGSLCLVGYFVCVFLCGFFLECGLGFVGVVFWDWVFYFVFCWVLVFVIFVVCGVLGIVVVGCFMVGGCYFLLVLLCFVWRVVLVGLGVLGLWDGGVVFV